METTTVDAATTQDATAEHAQILGVIFARLAKSLKARKAAETAIKGAWIGKADLSQLRVDRDAAIETNDRVMDESWGALNDLPNGTVAPGGATPQTVALQFYNSMLNRNLRKRLSATDARNLNRRSFG
jgi:hypothetical protein